jgi:type II secretory pathway pseudopilin PulG
MGRFFLTVVLFFVAVSLSVTNSSRGAESRHPIPSQEQQRATQKLIDEVYTDPKPATLIRDAIRTRDDPAAKYMLLRLGGTLATDNGDFKTAMYAVDQLSTAYAVDGLKIKTAILEQISRKVRDRKIHALLVDESLTLCDQAMSQDRFELAKKLVGVALKAAKKTKSKSVIRNCVAMQKQVANRGKAFKQIEESLQELAEDPNNPQLNLAVGNYFCFEKGDWDTGLSHLALGEDPALKAVAIRELKQPSTATAQVELADLWWQLAEQGGDVKKSMQARAQKWYTVALPKLSGLEKKKIASRLAESGGSYPGRGQRALFAQQNGGNERSEAAVEEALRWLANHQNRDGSWSWNHTPGGRCSGFANPGEKRTRMGATGLALLPFLAAGYTHQEGKGNKYKAVVQKGLQYLIGNMDPKSGRLYDRNGPDHEHMYSHGIAASAVAEAYGMTQDRKLKTPAKQALNYIVNAQDPRSGGWLYTPGQGGDTSVTGWQVMAIKSGEQARLKSPDQVKQGARKWFDRVQSDFAAQGGGIGSRYGYRKAKDRHNHQYSRAVTAIGLLCRNYLGTKKDDPGLRKGVEWLASQGPAPSDMYSNYYASLVMFQNDGPQGPLWGRWNSAMRDRLINAQVQTGNDRGSWHFSGNHGNDGGRLYNTCLAALTLEVYYRYPPIY